MYADLLSSPRSRARPRWHVIAAPVLLACIPLLGGLYWIQRPHEVVYRASASGCGYSVRYATHEGEIGPVAVRDRWETAAIPLVHGDVASMVVMTGPGCAVVRCELEEDGRVVARSEGTAAAICTAWTAR